MGEWENGQLLAFSLTLIALVAISRWITREVQMIGLRLTGSERVALLGYYFLLLPGIVLHELSHAVVAWLLGLKVGKFALGPKMRGRYVELGSVQVSSGGAIRDSLVGLAPFLAGTAVLLLVGYNVFDVAMLGRAWNAAGWPGVLNAMDSIWRVPDFWPWTYAIFAASNAMMPSPADRQPWLAAGLYVALALICAYFLGGLPALAHVLAPKVNGALQLLTLAFMFTLVLDLLAAVILWAAEMVIIEIQRHTAG
jgi:hypothetical protein